MRETLIAELEKIECDVRLDAAGKVQSIYAHRLVLPSDKVKYLGAFPELRDLDLADCVHDDSIWPVLATLPNLEKLTLWAGFATDSKGPKEIEFAGLEGATSRGVSDNGSEVLRGLLNLRSLDLRGTKVGDATLANIAQLKSLETLDLLETKVTGRGLVHISALHNLKKLCLDSTAVDDAGLASLSGLINLTALGLQRTKVTDAGMVHLGKLVALKTLSLQGTAVTGNGLSSLGTLEKLESLDCSAPPLTDVGIQALKNLRSLRYLYLECTMTVRQFRHFQAELPMVSINEEPTENERRSQANEEGNRDANK
jgi:Leucine-rich repeat (LRR) protein